MGNTIPMNTVKANSELFNWQFLFDKIPASILVFDRDLQCIKANGFPCENITGKSPDFLLGRNIRDLLISNDLKALIIGKFIASSTGNKAIDFTVEVKDEYKISHSVTASIQAMFDEKTNELSSFVVVNYSKELETERDESISESDWSLFSNMNDFIIVVDKQGDIKYINRSFLGKPVSETISTNIKDYFEGEESMIIKAALHRVFKDGTSLCFDNLLNITGTPRWFSSTINPVINTGDITLAVFVCREISGMKNRINELQEINNIGNSVIENITEGVMVIDSSGNIVMMNNSAQNFYGRSYRDLAEMEDDSEIRVEEMESLCDFSSIVEPILKVLAGEKSKPKECTLYSPNFVDGIVLQSKIKPINKNKGTVDGVVVILKDVTITNKANDKLHEAYKSLDDFVQATAHDLKSPVSNIRNLFSLMERVDEPEKKEVFLDKVKKSVDKLDDLLEALMEMANSNANGNRTIEKLSFPETFEFIKEEIQASISESNAKITCDFSKAKSIVFNKAFLRSILLNLMTNAIKYREDDRDLEIELTTSKIGDSILLEVEDNGMGIDLKRYKDDLFKPFRRLSSKGEGKGIGLNLVKSFVEKNGGDIMVESKKGRGTKFLIYLKPYNENESQFKLF